MALSLGQFASSMGVIANRQRAAEDAMLAQRQRELQVQELNKLNEIRARQGQGAIDAANQPLLQFDQMPGQPLGAPSALPPPPAPATTNGFTPVPAQPTQPRAGVVVPGTVPAPAPAAPAAAAPQVQLRPPAQLATIPTKEMTAAEFQSLPEAERVRRLQDLNALRTTVGTVGVPVASAGYLTSGVYDVFAGPYNLAARGVNWLGEKANVTGIGRQLGVIPQNVVRQDLLPLIGDESLTPMANRALRQVRQDAALTTPMTEAQLIESLRSVDTTKAAAAEKARVENVQKATAEGYADWMLDDKGNPVRGLRNNNPGNIKFNTNSPWKGSMRDANGNYINDGEFVRFDTPEAGIRAMTMNLMSYDNRGVNTIRGIVNNWSTTDRASYTKFLSEQLGVKPDDVVNVKDPATMEKLIRGIIQMENGKVPYDPRTIETGIALGFNQDAPVVTASTPNAPRLPSPAQQVATAIQTGSPTEVATAASQVVKLPATPAASGTMQGAPVLPPNAQNPEIQQLLTARNKLQQDVRLYAQYGMGDKAWETVSKIQALDLGMYKNQADFGIYEGATSGNFSRAMSVLSTFTNSPHQVLQRPDGNYDLYINGQVAKNGVNLTGPQVEQLVRTRVDSAYRSKLAEIQAARGEEAFKSDLRIREESSKQYLTGLREANNELIKGNFQAAIKQMEMAGFKPLSLGDGKALMANPRGETYLVDSETKTISIGGNTAQVGPSATRISGINTTGIWSAVNAPQQVTER
jgi:hypothetical protein